MQHGRKLTVRVDFFSSPKYFAALSANQIISHHIKQTSALIPQLPLLPTLLQFQKQTQKSGVGWLEDNAEDELTETFSALRVKWENWVKFYNLFLIFTVFLFLFLELVLFACEREKVYFSLNVSNNLHNANFCFLLL